MLLAGESPLIDSEQTMNLRICRSLQGSIDGVALEHFLPGHIYDITGPLAALFLAEGWAQLVDLQLSNAHIQRSAVAGPILVVDDEPDMRQLAADVLRLRGYEVLEARNGLEAIQQLCHHCPALVLLDLNMPVMDGWQFRTHQQRLANPVLATTPVLLLTGADDAEHQTRSLKTAGLIMKPYDPLQLLDAVETVLHHH